MSRIKRIERFLSEYQSIDPYFKSICEDSHDYFKRELGKEYKRVSEHPFPHEYTGTNYLNIEVRPI